MLITDVSSATVLLKRNAINDYAAVYASKSFLFSSCNRRKRIDQPHKQPTRIWSENVFKVEEEEIM